MDGSFESNLSNPLDRYRAAVQRILDVQLASGAIPWFEKGPWDPWNHVESAMALTAVGEHDAAISAFDYLCETQRADGAWLGEYGNALPMVDRDFISREAAPAVLDTNFCAYPAVGVAHFFLATRDRARLTDWYPMVKAALDFVVSLQRADGSIPWSAEAIGTEDDDALLAGNASIAKSLECGVFLAHAIGDDSRKWARSRASLLNALRNTPEVFDRRKTGARYAMDWYYPVLAGYLDGIEAEQRIQNGWTDFVVPNQGCRCVSDEPWVTVAETCELVMALLVAGKPNVAGEFLPQIDDIRDDRGVYWMGRQFSEELFWPREQPSWTQAAVILAADALHECSDASQLLVSPLLTAAEAI